MTFEIGYPWLFWLAPLPILIYWLMPALRMRRSALIFPNVFQAAHTSKSPLKRSAWVSRRNIFQWLILWAIWGCVLFAATSPQLVGQPEVKIKTARSFVVAADISFSMATKDWVVDGKRMSRWEAVKSVLYDFVETRDGDRVSLVFFGTHAYLQAPLTTDLAVIKQLLDETDVGMAGQSTGIGEAIGFGIKLFEKDTMDQKVMLLLTDGVDAGKGVSPLDAANLAKKDSVTIYTLGIGDPTVSGSDLDESTLKKIAEATAGEYFLAMDVDQLVAASDRLSALEPMEYEEEQYKPSTLLFYYPLICAFLLGLVLQLFRIVGNAIKNRRYND